MFNKMVWIAMYSLVILLYFSCTTNSENSKSYSPKFQQYYVQGQVLYQKHCSHCHQTDGKGLGRVYPPIERSDFMDMNLEAVLCMIKYGKEGRLMVNGVDYNMPMKGNPGLTELEVAEITTYIYNTWTHDRGIIDVGEVSQVLSSCNN